MELRTYTYTPVVETWSDSKLFKASEHNHCQVQMVAIDVGLKFDYTSCNHSFASAPYLGKKRNFVRFFSIIIHTSTKGFVWKEKPSWSVKLSLFSWKTHPCPSLAPTDQSLLQLILVFSWPAVLPACLPACMPLGWAKCALVFVWAL